MALDVMLTENRWMKGKDKEREVSQDATRIIQSALDQGGGNGDGKQSGSGYIVKVETIGFDDSF